MADLTALADVGHVWGSDVLLSPTGDLSRVSSSERSRQRVYRRLLTNPATTNAAGIVKPGDYVFHPDYGGGIPAMVGQVLDLAKIRARIKGQMLLEASVARSPAPQVALTQLTDGVSVAISYIALPDRQPVSLSFNVSA